MSPELGPGQLQVRTRKTSPRSQEMPVQQQLCDIWVPDFYLDSCCPQFFPAF